MTTPASAQPILFEGTLYPTKQRLCGAYGLKKRTVLMARKRLRLQCFKTAFRITLARARQRRAESLSKFEKNLLSLAQKRSEKIKESPNSYPRIVKYGIGIPITYKEVRYESLNEICRAFTISPTHVAACRKEYACSYAEAVDKAIQARDAREIRAFGTVYTSLVELAQHKKVDENQLRRARQAEPDRDIEDIVKDLKSEATSQPKPRRHFPEEPILFGWLFPSWNAAWEYWKPLGVNKRAFYDYLAEGADIDARCHHELIIQAERGNLTKDLRRADQLNWAPDQGGPIEKVAIFNRFNLKERLAPYELAKPPRKRRSTRQMVKASGVQISTSQVQAS